MAALAGDAAMRARMGAAARATVHDRSWGRLGDQLLGYYRQVAGTRAGDAGVDRAA